MTTAIADTDPPVEPLRIPAPQPPPARPTHLLCDMTEAGIFSPRYGNAHAPVQAAFGDGPLHLASIHGCYDLGAAITGHGQFLARSIQRLTTEGQDAPWDDLTFCLADRAYAYMDQGRINAYSTSAVRSQDLALEFHKAYSKPPEPRGGFFHLVRTGRDISYERVPLPPATVLTEETFRLHYGGSAWDWHQHFAAQVRARDRGLALLEGPAGTGKSSYLRHLMGVLRETHRFYFIPTSSMGVLSNPDFIGFWADQRRRHQEQRFVVILEDADGLLMSRGSDNREQVSALLNLTDGMLADFLRLQIICTINCRSADLDSALLRPGRLIGRRTFGPLTFAEANELARSLGKSLTTSREYTLAEVFADDMATSEQPRRIGFAS